MKVYVIEGKRGKWVLRWQLNGKWREQTTDIPTRPKSKKKLAERLAAAKEMELDGVIDDPKDWDQFVGVYTDQVLDPLSKHHQQVTSRLLERFAEICNPSTIEDVDSKMVSRFVTELRKKTPKQATIDGYLKKVMAAFNWAYSMGYLRKRIRYKRKQSKEQSHMRSRPITLEEFERMIDSVETVRPNDTKLWKFYLRGLWASGLRLEESVKLGWEWSSDISVDIDSKVPHYRIMSEGQKSGRDEILPIVPAFLELLQSVPERQRRGRVFKLPKGSGDHPHPRTAGKVIGRIGAMANVVVNRDGKTATAHDLRRSFGSQWATKVMPPVLKQLMRHDDIQTTMKFYVHLEAEELWEQINKPVIQKAEGEHE